MSADLHKIVCQGSTYACWKRQNKTLVKRPLNVLWFVCKRFAALTHVFLPNYFISPRFKSDLLLTPDALHIFYRMKVCILARSFFLHRVQTSHMSAILALGLRFCVGSNTLWAAGVFETTADSYIWSIMHELSSMPSKHKDIPKGCIILLQTDHILNAKNIN